MSYKFDEKELEVLGRFKGIRGADFPIFKTPVTDKQAWKQLALERKPIWANTGAEVFNFYPDVIPDNRARGFVNDEGISIPDSEKGGKDMFGIEWVYVPVAGGSMEKPGVKPLFDYADDWEDRIVWPDIDSWDWEGSAKRNKEFLKTDKFNYLVLLNGFGFERLISFMGFEDAAVALIDEEQQDALRALFTKLSDLYIRIIDKCVECYDIDGFLIHDDWGTQPAPFFSFETGKEMLVPFARKITDHIHALGKAAELHSCGCNYPQIENFIAAGWDIWAPMSNINDTQKLFNDYGDKIIIGVQPDLYDKDNATEEEIRKAANDFANKFCTNDGKVFIINRYFAPYINDTYAEELYRVSRQIYSK